MKSLAFGCVFYFLIQLSSCYRMDIEDEAQYCEYRKHMTIKPTATCCANKVIAPGINLAAHWAACGSEIKGKSDTLEGIGWDMYSCILKKSSGEKEEFSLQEFSDLVTAQYPDDIKTPINEEVQKQSVSAAALTDYAALDKIRITYYDIERAVCEGTVGESSYGMSDDTCSVWKEENHRGGMCCKKAYPVDIRLNSKLAQDIKSATEITNFCRQFILGPALELLNITDTTEMNIMDVCEFACQMAGNEELNFREDIMKNSTWYLGFDLDTELNEGRKHWLPTFFHDDIVSKAKQYVQSVFSIQNTIKAMQDYEFADVIDDKDWTTRSHHFIAFVQPPEKEGDNFKLDFKRRKFHEDIINVPIMCSAYHEIATLMEHAVYKECNVGEEVKQLENGEAEPASEPEPEPEPTTAPEPEPEQTAAPESEAEPTTAAE